VSASKAVIRLIEAQRTSDGAGVTLYRSLGQSQHVRLDPFLMLDEFGSDRADEYIAGFPAHPHRGFQTVTYMLAGHMLHEDHLGNKGHLKSGGVQWMTAGRGIIHSEMPQQESGLMRGFQLWINLPAREKMCAAGYRDLDAAEIPVFESAGLVVKVIAGELQREGRQIRGPITGLSTEPIFWDVHLAAGQCFEERLPVDHATYLYVYEGEIEVGATPDRVRARQGAVLGEGEQVRLHARQAARALLLCAKPIGEPIVQYGPFVMNTREEIERAVRDYQSGRLTA
jgi:redox-sensitive bicupin YhaK (pirin superfamily)